MESQFNKVKKLAQKFQQESWKLDRMIYDTYGFRYSENDDRIIDTLECGTDDITFENFKSRMTQYKIDFEEDDRFSNIP